MAYARVVYTANGSADTFNFNFPYINRSHVKVTLNGTAVTPDSFPTAQTVKLPSAPLAGTEVVIYRETPVSVGLTNFQRGSTLTAGDLTVDSNQARFLIQEEADKRELAVAGQQSYTDTKVADLDDRKIDKDDVEQFLVEVGSDSAQVQFVAPSEHAVLRSVASKLRDTISVKDFGAVGDGVTDDRPAFQLALDYANSIGGASVAVPYSSTGYRLVGVFRIGSNTRLYGDGGMVRLIRGAAGSMLNNGLGYTTASEIPAYGGHKNIVIENLIFDPDVANIPSGLTHLALGYGDNILVRNCITLDGGTGHHVDMAACRDVRFENCKFLGTKIYATPPEQNDALQLDSDKPGSFPYFGVPTNSPCLRIKVTGCVFGPNPDNPDPDFIAPPVGVGSHGNIAFGSLHQNIEITNCDFTGCSFAAVHARKWSDIKISGCTIFDCGDGVLIEAASAGESGHTEADAGRSFVVTHNTFSSLSGCAVRSSPITLGTVLSTRTMDLVVSNNTVKGSTGDDAFDLRSVRSVSVTGNIVNGNYRLLYAVDAERLTVSDNSVSNVQFEGIYIGAGCLDFSVTGNMIVGAQTRGVWVTGGAKGGVVSGNQIKNFAIGSDTTPHGVYVNSSSENVLVTGNNFSKSVTTMGSGPDVVIASSCVDCSTANNTSNTGFVPVSNSCATGFSQGIQGSGSPEGVITAPIGSTYVNRSGGTSTTFYVKTSGTGNTGWTAK